VELVFLLELVAVCMGDLLECFRAGFLSLSSDFMCLIFLEELLWFILLLLWALENPKGVYTLRGKKLGHNDMINVIR
jgi:hypothetical protein